MARTETLTYHELIQNRNTCHAMETVCRSRKQMTLATFYHNAAIGFQIRIDRFLTIK